MAGVHSVSVFGVAFPAMVAVMRARNRARRADRVAVGEAVVEGFGSAIAIGAVSGTVLSLRWACCGRIDGPVR